MRRVAYLITFCWLGLAVKAQTNIQVILVTNEPIDRVYVSNNQSQHFYVPYTDTAHFSFKSKEIDLYTIAYKQGDKSYECQAWLNPGEVTIMAHLDQQVLYIDSVLNAPIYYTARGVIERFSQLLHAEDTATLSQFLLRSFEENVDNAFSYFPGMSYVTIHVNSRPDLLQLKKLRIRQGSRFEWLPFYRDFSGELDRHLDTAPVKVENLPLTDRLGKKSRIALQGGRTYVLNFWYLSNANALQEQKVIQSMQNKFHALGIVVIGVSIDEADQYQTWKAYLSENGYDWPNYLDNGRGNVSTYFGVHSFPTYVVLDRECRVLKTYYTFSEVLKEFGLDKP